MFPGLIWFYDDEPNFEWFAIGIVLNGESCQSNFDYRYGQITTRPHPIDLI